MTAPNNSSGEVPRAGEYATPEQVAAFVSDAIAAFAARGSEFLSPDAVEETPMYVIEGISYDPLLTPNLEPFDRARIDAIDLAEVEGPSNVEVYFSIPVFRDSGIRRLLRIITLWNNGDVNDVTEDRVHEARTRDPDEPTRPASHRREDVHAYFEYVIGKEALRKALDEAEGLPVGPPQISKAELDDIRRLLPVSGSTRIA